MFLTLDGILCVRKYVSYLKRPFDVRYDPYTQSIQVLDNVKELGKLSEKIRADIDVLSGALDKLNYDDIGSYRTLLPPPAEEDND